MPVNSPLTKQHPPRSKNGCLTCRRRKVRCNEKRPRCGHCERLNLQCAWRSNARDSTPAGPPVRIDVPSHRASEPQPSIVDLEPTQTAVLDQTLSDWDFNDLIWHDTSALDPSTTNWLMGEPSRGSDPTFGALGNGVENTSSTGHSGSTAVIGYISNSLAGSINSAHRQSDVASPASSVGAGSHALVEHFLASDVPPILASVEVGPRWTSTKILFASLARASTMVRNAVMAFSALQLEGQTPGAQSEHRTLYEKAYSQLSSIVASVQSDPVQDTADLSAPLAAVFFLAYSDLLTNRSIHANAVLKGAASLVKAARTREFSLVERRLISWVRLVDGRTSSAGGDGTFLSSTESDAYSPRIYERSASGEESTLLTIDADAEIQEILFDILYTPGLAFYQRVQSIMARVSNIDPWHRPRGTVQDETEVMALAATILNDLRALERQRPALMEHAVAGSLNERHLAMDIALAITRSYRTYWANYEAGFIHLHRVAHKHLPATPEVMRARSTIKSIVRLFEQTGEPLPTNFIWPLLMACCEEDELKDRSWMIGAIRSMQGVACNARPIANVLEEVHRRQDATKQRADVRQVSMDLLNMSFAVV